MPLCAVHASFRAQFSSSVDRIQILYVSTRLAVASVGFHTLIALALMNRLQVPYSITCGDRSPIRSSSSCALWAVMHPVSSAAAAARTLSGQLGL